jgi:hypothetical protein
VVPKIPSFQTLLRYSDRGRGIVRGVYVCAGVEVLELLRYGDDICDWGRE